LWIVAKAFLKSDFCVITNTCFNKKDSILKNAFNRLTVAKNFYGSKGKNQKNIYQQKRIVI